VNTTSLLSAFLTAILIGGLVLASALRFGTVQASTDVSGIPKPPVPEFTLKVVEHPYDVPPTYSTDPYTGKSIMTQPGYHVENKSIEVTVKNQPFSPYNDVNGNSIGLYYNITVKGHYENTWDYCFNNPYRGLLNASNSDNTIISMPIGGHASVPLGGYPLEGVDVGDQVDFRVQAQIGYYNKSYTGMFAPVPGGDFYYVFTGETSDWSNIQTITIGESQTPTPSPATTPTPDQTPTPTPSQEPQQTEQIEPIVGAAIVVAVIIAVLGLLIYLIKRK
jgi:hypothetical protein